MSAWRREALKALPELHNIINFAWSPMWLWIELRLTFEDDFASGNTKRLNRILTYMRYCLAASDPDVRNAVHCAFVEHLPQKPAIRAALSELLTLREIRDLRQVLAYHVGEAAITEIERECRRRGDVARRGS